MKLDAYLTETKTSKKALADALGVTEEAVRLWVTGQRKPRQEQLDALHRATEGRVSANDFWHTDQGAA